MQEQQLYLFRVWLSSKEKKNWYWQYSPITYFYRIADFKTSQRSTHEVRLATQVDKALWVPNMIWRNGLEYRYFWGDISNFNELRYRTRIGVNLKLSDNKKLIINNEIMYRWNIDEELVLWDQNRSNVSIRIHLNALEFETGYQFHFRNTNRDNIEVHLLHFNLKYIK